MAILGVNWKENGYFWFLTYDKIFLIYSKMSGTSSTRVEKAPKAWCKQILPQRYQTFYYIFGKCYRRSKIKNSHFLFNLPPELPNQFLEKAIIEIDFFNKNQLSHSSSTRNHHRWKWLLSWAYRSRSRQCELLQH